MPCGEDSRDVVGDAVDAVTLNQEVQRERCARLATQPSAALSIRCARPGPQGRSCRNMGGGSLAEASPDSYGGAWVRGAVHAVVAIAAVEVAAALLLLPWAWEAYRREHGDGAVYMAGLLIAHGASACLLLPAGRRDRRTRLLGVFFLLKATLAPMHMLPALSLRDGIGLSRARHRTRSRRRGEDPGREVLAAADGIVAGGVDHGAGGASRGGADSRRRVLARQQRNHQHRCRHPGRLPVPP